MQFYMQRRILMEFLFFVDHMGPMWPLASLKIKSLSFKKIQEDSRCYFGRHQSCLEGIRVADKGIRVAWKSSVLPENESYSPLKTW